MLDPMFTAAIAFSLSQVLLSLILLLRYRQGWKTQEFLFFCFLISTSAYLMFPLVEDGAAEKPVLVLQTLLPGLFWLLCQSLFVDGFSIKKWQLFVISLTAFIPRLAGMADGIHHPIHGLLFKLFPQAIELALIIFALLAIVRFWKDDLVQARRDLRLWCCGIIGPYLLLMVVLREVLFYEAQWLKYWQYLPVGIICMLTNVLLLQYKVGLINRVIGKSEESNEVPEDVFDKQAKVNGDNSDVEVPQELLDALEALMLEERVYREMGLTIGDVAKRLVIPEYRLRKIINAGLGYRNFSDFLNGYRINEAAERLRDPRHAEKAVLNIALDIGFRSISTFNKAFRAKFAQTPTAYRADYLQQDASK